MKFCGECGYKLDDDAVFCSNCGSKLAAFEAVVEPHQAIPEAIVEPPQTITDAVVETSHARPLVQVDMKKMQESTKAVAQGLESGIDHVNNALNSDTANKYIGSMDKLCLVGYAGAIIGMISVFFPAISFARLGVSAMDGSRLLAVVIMLLGAFAMYGIKIGKYGYALATGQTYLLMIVFFIYTYYSEVSRYGKMGSLVNKSIEFDSGFYLMMLGGFVLVAVSGLMVQKLRGHMFSLGGAFAGVCDLENVVTEFMGIKCQTWIYTVIFSVILLIVQAKEFIR